MYIYLLLCLVTYHHTYLHMYVHVPTISCHIPPYFHMYMYLHVLCLVTYHHTSICTFTYYYVSSHTTIHISIVCIYMYLLCLVTYHHTSICTCTYYVLLHTTIRISTCYMYLHVVNFHHTSQYSYIQYVHSLPVLSTSTIPHCTVTYSTYTACLVNFHHTSQYSYIQYVHSLPYMPYIAVAVDWSRAHLTIDLVLLVY